MMATAARIANPDVIVVGLGAVGSSTLLALARMGISALGIDRHSPPHPLGSSHGDTRLTRLAVGEGAEYAPLVARSHELWLELEGRVGVVGNDDDGGEEGRRLFLRTGGLVVGRPTTATSFDERTIDVARERGIPHEVVDADEMRSRWPQVGSGLVGDEVGCHEPSAGVLFPERCVRAQLGLAVRLGARTMLGTIVRSVSSDDGGGGVRVVTDDRGDFVAASAIVAPGAWASDLVPSLAPLTRVRRQAMHWFPLNDPDAYSPERFPVFIWHHGSGVGDYFYGFPCLPGEVSMKMATEQCERRH